MENDKNRAKRKKQTAEDFTPSSLVNETLDKLNEYGKESWEEGKTFCDPACGNGNMLIEVLKRKISLGHDPVRALSTIYGADIMQDNIMECRFRIFEILKDYDIEITPEIVETVLTNIVWVSQKRNGLSNGSLDYDFSFTGSNLKEIYAKNGDGKTVRIRKHEIIDFWLFYLNNPTSIDIEILKDGSVTETQKVADARKRRETGLQEGLFSS